ncbi:hypothetical protein ACFRBN_31540, partial [Streptomyces sp. NPDC056627]|uniref:hypothetical protein n=1 Tax=Streptomyces sp. NPDC056627 TaxID=3345881 RepID=UPI003694C080
SHPGWDSGRFLMGAIQSVIGSLVGGGRSVIANSTECQQSLSRGDEWTVSPLPGASWHGVGFALIRERNTEFGNR